jgi:hypothetical protein
MASYNKLYDLESNIRTPNKTLTSVKNLNHKYQEDIKSNNTIENKIIKKTKSYNLL